MSLQALLYILLHGGLKLFVNLFKSTSFHQPSGTSSELWADFDPSDAADKLDHNSATLSNRGERW